MKPKSLKTFVFYTVFVCILYKFITTIKNLILKNIYLFSNNENPLFKLVYAKNTGAAFSFMTDNAYIFGILGIIVLILIMVYIYKHVEFKQKILIFTSAIFSAGVLGNTLERLINGYVIDYIKLNFIDFPVFNLFDVMITLSIVIFIIFTISKNDFLPHMIKKIK